MLVKKSKGFTLIELMIVLAVMLILAAIAYPSYSAYGYRARRVDAKTKLAAAAAAQERVYTNFNAYASTITGALAGNPPAGLGFTSDLSDDGHYQISVAGLGGANQTYTLTATPVVGDVQTNDVCGSLTLDNTGRKTPLPTAMPQNSNGKCW